MGEEAFCSTSVMNPYFGKGHSGSVYFGDIDKQDDLCSGMSQARTCKTEQTYPVSCFRFLDSLLLHKNLVHLHQRTNYILLQ